jgi:hypothetical protein
LFMKLGQRQSNSMKKRTLRLDKGFVTTWDSSGID